MPFVLILVGLVLMVSAFRNTQDQLEAALEQDIPGFSKWFAALALTGGLGYVPGFQTLSRWLLALVLVVLVVRNYQQVFAGFADAFSQTASLATASAGGGATPTLAQAAPLTATNINAAQSPTIGTSGPYDPASYLTNFASNLPTTILDTAILGVI